MSKRGWIGLLVAALLLTGIAGAALASANAPDPKGSVGLFQQGGEESDDAGEVEDADEPGDDDGPGEIEDADSQHEAEDADEPGDDDGPGDTEDADQGSDD
jgi:hypothetical protein